MPATTELENNSENEKNREQTWKALLKFKELLDSSLTLMSDQLSELTATDISAIEIILKSRGETEWFGRTKDNKTVCLSLRPANKEKADIVLTFVELYAIKTAMEVLEIEEITIGTYNSTSVSQNGIFNNISQLWNHNQFWEMMGPDGRAMPSELEAAIVEIFGSVESF